MLYCEDCRLKKNWPVSAGYPYIGLKLNETCGVCGKHRDCHDLPALRLVPDSEKTVEQKLLDKMMNEAYKQKAEELVIDFGGIVNHRLTNVLKGAIIKRNHEIDWQQTYELRLVLQRTIRASEQLKREKRK